MVNWEEIAVRAFFVNGLIVMGGCSGGSSQLAEGLSSSAARIPVLAAPSPAALTGVAGPVSLGGSHVAGHETALSAVQPPKSTEKPVLAVDVDETLCITDYNSLLWGIGDDDTTALPGAQPTLSRLAASFDLVYLTARSRSLKNKTQHWLDRHGFPGGRLVTSPTLGDFIFQGDFKRKVLRKLRHEHPNMVIGIGDKAKDAEAYRSNHMLAVIVNPWSSQRYHTDDVICRDWSAVSDFFSANHELLSDPRLLSQSLSRGRLKLDLSSKAREYQGRS